MSLSLPVSTINKIKKHWNPIFNEYLDKELEAYSYFINKEDNVEIDNRQEDSLFFDDYMIEKVINKKPFVFMGYCKELINNLAIKFKESIIEKGLEVNTMIKVKKKDFFKECINAVRTLEERGISKEDLVLLIYPAIYWEVTKPYTKELSSSIATNSPKGFHGAFNNVPILINTQVPKRGCYYYNLLIDRKSIFYKRTGVRMQTQTQLMREKDQDSIKGRLVADIAYGIKNINPQGGIQIVVKS